MQRQSPAQLQAALRHVLAKNLRRLREGRGLSQEAFAEECGLHRTYVGSVERAERNVTLGTLATLSVALNVSVCVLLTSAETEGE